MCPQYLSKAECSLQSWCSLCLDHVHDHKRKSKRCSGDFFRPPRPQMTEYVYDLCSHIWGRVITLVWKQQMIDYWAFFCCCWLLEQILYFTAGLSSPICRIALHILFVYIKYGNNTPGMLCCRKKYYTLLSELKTCFHIFLRMCELKKIRFKSVSYQIRYLKPHLLGHVSFDSSDHMMSYDKYIKTCLTCLRFKCCFKCIFYILNR